MSLAEMRASLETAPPRQIACLSCGEVRVTYGTRLGETDQCPRCLYLGWTFADDMDGTTIRMVMNGELARRHLFEPADASRNAS